MKENDSTGDRVGGYRVVRRLATGGTSDVLLAKAEGPHGFERPVVLKILLSKYERDSELKAMFAREAAAYARLSHPAIVRLYDFFANGDQLVMVLEYIDGPPLSRLRGMLKTVVEPFDDATAMHVAGCIFEALAAAHAATDEAGEPAPVIHRDVNPSNVLVSWDAQVKLADFGVAKVTGVNHQSTAGLIKGTYGYMAPEQVKGETVTPRADVYAGAIVLWEMLTKRRAFIRGALPEIEVLRELAEPRIVSIDTLRPDLDNNLREVLKRALEPRADKRAMTAEEVVATLRGLVSAEEGQTRLGKALALVRHEPNASQTSIPPPLLEADAAPGKLFPRENMALRAPLFPRPTPAPRPAAQVPRRTAPYGANPVVGESPHPPVLVPRPRTLEKEMPASTLSPEDVAVVIEKRSHAGPPPVAGPDEEDEGLGPSSVPGLASVLEPSSDPKVIARRASERLRLGTPLAAVTAGKLLGAAIDDILRDGGAELGRLPPAPRTLEPVRPDLDATLVMPVQPATGRSDSAPGVTAAPNPSSFPQLNRTLTMNLEKPTPLGAMPVADIPAAAQPPPASQAVTAAMPMGPPPLNPSTAKMGPFALPQGAPPPPATSSAGTTLPLASPLLARGTSPPVPASARESAPSYPGQPVMPPSGPPTMEATAPLPPSHASHSSRAGQPPSGSRDAVTRPPYRRLRERPPARKRSPAFAIFAVLVIGGAATGAGALGYRQRHKAQAAGVQLASVPGSRAGSTAGTPSMSGTPSTSGTPSAISTRVTAASATSASENPTPAGNGANAEEAGFASASTGGVAPSPALAPASVAEGMGRVSTLGTTPGRRIFVDERTVGQTPEAVTVKCGVRRIKLGSSGTTQSIEVPCGGDIAIGDR